ncbi:hypothetical protein BDV93DRAFT_510379 [Ceratobasidium sp. AG-I]|nr:hypothetical protein BDV93DRAFT_510379 [Ceratobasidium sp. AG-I]
MSPHVLRLFFGLVPLLTFLAQQSLPTAALVLQERQPQGPTLPGNVTQDVLQVASAISPPCANIDSCISLVTDMIPRCEERGGDPGCWCANHDALHTTADQTEAAAAGHSGFHVACDAYAEIVNGTSATLASNATANPIGKSHLSGFDPFRPKFADLNIRADGTSLIVHSSKDLASGLGKKVAFTWSFARIVIRIDFNTETLELSGSIGVKIPWVGYRNLVNFSRNLGEAVVVSWSSFGVGGSATFFVRDGLWLRNNAAENERHTYLACNGLNFLNLSFLFSSPTTLVPLFQYIRSTGRFSGTVG